MVSSSQTGNCMVLMLHRCTPLYAAARHVCGFSRVPVHLTCQVDNLRLVSNIFEQDKALHIQCDGPCFLARVKQVLCYKNYARVCMMAYSRKNIGNRIICFVHQVIQN